MTERRSNRNSRTNGDTLPVTTTTTMPHPTASSRSKKRTRSTSSKSFSTQAFLFQTIVGCSLTVVIVMYVIATRHVMLQQSTTTISSKGMNDLEDSRLLPAGGRTTSSAFYAAQRVLFQPNNNNAATANTILPPLSSSSSSSFDKKPRSLGYFYGHVNTTSFVGVDTQPLPVPDNFKLRIRRSTLLTEDDMERQKELLENSKDYRSGKAETMADMGRDCVAQYDWQLHFYPTCNNVMEIDMIESLLLGRRSKQKRQQQQQSKQKEGSGSHDNDTDDDATSSTTTPTNRIQPSTTLQFLDNGYWRDVWRLDNILEQGNISAADTTDDDDGNIGGEVFIFKTQRYEHDFLGRNYDRHRRDAVAMERLTPSPFIMGIYGYCATSGVFEFADGGSLEDALWALGHDHAVEPWNAQERLVVSYQVAAALAAVHNYPKEGVPAIAHTDIATGQYVYSRQASSFKLQDFNRARFLAWNNKTDTPCTYTVGNNPGTLRSPEEYAYKRQTEKVDVYSMGNIFYSILTLNYPFEGKKSKEVYQRIADGDRPLIAESIRNSTDPYDRTMLEVIEMCWRQDPTERATARQVQQHIVATLKELKVQQE